MLHVFVFAYVCACDHVMHIRQLHHPGPQAEHMKFSDLSIKVNSQGKR